MISRSGTLSVIQPSAKSRSNIQAQRGSSGAESALRVRGRLNILCISPALVPLGVERNWRHWPWVPLSDHVGGCRSVFFEVVGSPMRLIGGFVIVDLVQEE